LRQNDEPLAVLDTNQTLIPWIGKTGKMLSIFLNHRLQDLGLHLTTKQWILLHILHENDGRPQNELAIITERDKASLVRLINNMEKNMLVIRVQDQNDKRVNRIYLSKKGRKVYATAVPEIHRAYREIEDGITQQEIEQTILILQKLLQNICKTQLVG
jgi:DNA-binding MarR family transcriptional regulator